MRQVLAGLLVLVPTLALAQEPRPVADIEAEVHGLRAPKPAWREIPWKSCLLEGIAEARARKKPILLWIFIDRPVDDARC